MSHTAGDDFLDSRALQKRYDSLKDDFDCLIQELRDALDRVEEADDRSDINTAKVDLDTAFNSLSSWIEIDDDSDEYFALKALIEQADGYGDWNGGETLIHEDKFVEYIQEWAYDTGRVERDSTVANYMDWDKYAADMEGDYMDVEFDGNSYKMRA